MSRDLSRRSASGAKADRDRKFELALTQELRTAGTPDPDACIDSETLGAWADGGLDAAQMAAVELHVATCARCQAIIGATARSAPAISPLVGARGFRFPSWAIAPLAAAAAITIWMVVPQDRMQAPPAPAQVDAPRKEAVAPAPEPDSARPTEAKESAAVTTARAAPTAPVDTPERAREQSGADASTPQVRQQRAEERAAPTLGAAASQPAPPAAAAPAIADSMLTKSARLSFAPLEIVSPDPTSRWRVVNNAIERSEDAGASWVPLRAAGGQTFTAGASPARSVCWLIGTSGLVMVTADGLVFAPVPLPERVDLTAITATDARSATVTTADGRRFRTDDSGRTWRQIQA